MTASEERYMNDSESCGTMAVEPVIPLLSMHPSRKIVRNCFFPRVNIVRISSLARTLYKYIVEEIKKRLSVPI